MPSRRDGTKWLQIGLQRSQQTSYRGSRNQNTASKDPAMPPHLRRLHTDRACRLLGCLRVMNELRFVGADRMNPEPRRAR